MDEALLCVFCWREFVFKRNINYSRVLFFWRIGVAGIPAAGISSP